METKSKAPILSVVSKILQDVDATIPLTTGDTNTHYTSAARTGMTQHPEENRGMAETSQLNSGAEYPAMHCYSGTGDNRGPEGAMVENPEAGNDEVKRKVLRIPVCNLVRIHDVLDELYEYMSIDNRWEDFAGILGLSLRERMLLTSLQSKKPNEYPGKTFLDNYFIKYKPNLSTLLLALKEMAERHRDEDLQLMISSLWSLAFHYNQQHSS